ncbi:AraC family transcriptional regulator [Aquimarina gracilis]|uniref:AraC family transcriptional regulator n=1 Tax=Aquimarina gracilis TaxID=874422 RepID=A0ABU5ZZN8_9FLAO|nr:AraC family transcriptional regulator [Aquimarina gracilis]MEB3347350.1 AraC family transcriptional regulator [Aquimarina gracilis]
MHTFDFTDLFLFLGISQGIFLAITIHVVQNKNKIANRVLSLLLILSSILLTGKFMYSFDAKNEWFFRIAVFMDAMIFILGPFLYMYCRRLIFNETPAFKIHYLYFVPFLGMCLYYIWTLTYTHQELIAMGRAGKLLVPFFTIETCGLAFNYYFCYRSYILIKTYERQEKKNLSYSQHVIAFLKVVLVVITVFFTMWLISYVSAYFLRAYLPYINYNTTWIAFPIFIYVIGFFSLKQPSIFRVPIAKKDRQKNKERVDGPELERLKNDLQKLMVEEKIYLNHKLTLIDMAQQLNTSSNNVSWLLNNIHESSFYDFINHYRVQEFINKVERGEHQNHTLLALSLDSGFNSKSTFNKAFKIVMNETPSNYIKKMRVI